MRYPEVINTRVRHGEGEFFQRIAEKNPGSTEVVVIENPGVVLVETRAYGGSLSEALDPSGTMLFTWGEKFPFKDDAILFVAGLQGKIKRSSLEIAAEIGVVVKDGLTPIEIPA